MSVRFNPGTGSTTITQEAGPSTPRVQTGYLRLEHTIAQRVGNHVQALLESYLFRETTADEIRNWERDFLENHAENFRSPEAAEALCRLICRMIRIEIAANHGNYTVRARLGILEAEARTFLAEALPAGTHVESTIRQFESNYTAQTLTNLMQGLLEPNLFRNPTPVHEWIREFLANHAASFPEPESADALCYLICALIRLEIAALPENAPARARLQPLEAQARALLDETFPQESPLLRFEAYYLEFVQLQNALALTQATLTQNEREEVAFYERQNTLAEERFNQVQGELVNYNAQGEASAQERARLLNSLAEHQRDNQSRMRTMAGTIEGHAAHLETQQAQLGQALTNVKNLGKDN